VAFTAATSTAEVWRRNGARGLDNLMTLIQAKNSFTTEEVLMRKS
jgi:hypothetical protein